MNRPTLPLWTLFALALAACASKLPVPQVGAHDGETPVIVPYPPPPPQAEVIGDFPTGQVWLDGQWKWDGRMWHWTAGHWETLSNDSLYAPPSITYLPDGTIGWYEGHVRKVPPKR